MVGTGVYLAGGALVTSDQRLKTSIQPLASALDKVMHLQGVSFRWKDTKRDQSTQIGVIAQEIQKVYPELVKEDGYGYYTVQYEGLVAPLIEAVKELKAENDALRAEIQAKDAAFAARLDALEARGK